MRYLCEPTTKWYQSRRPERICRAYPDELLSIEVTYDSRKCSSDCGLRVQRNALESKFPDPNADCLYAGEESNSQTQRR